MRAWLCVPEYDEFPLPFLPLPSPIIFSLDGLAFSPWGKPDLKSSSKCRLQRHCSCFQQVVRQDTEWAGTCPERDLDPSRWMYMKHTHARTRTQQLAQEQGPVMPDPTLGGDPVCGPTAVLPAPSAVRSGSGGGGV